MTETIPSDFRETWITGQVKFLLSLKPDDCNENLLYFKVKSTCEDGWRTKLAREIVVMESFQNCRTASNSGACRHSYSNFYPHDADMTFIPKC